MTHSLTRTSPFGTAFIGTCIKCGQENLDSGAPLLPCPADHTMSDEQGLIAAIEGPVPEVAPTGTALTQRVLVQAAACTLVFLSSPHPKYPRARSIRIVDFVDADGGSKTFSRIKEVHFLDWMWIPDDPQSRIEDIIHYLLAYFGPDGKVTMEQAKESKA